MEKHKALDQKSLEMWQQCGEVERKARNHEAPETCRLSRMGSEEMHDKLTHLTKTKRTIQILGKKGGMKGRWVSARRTCTIGRDAMWRPADHGKAHAAKIKIEDD